jgi:hypothetical protein
LERKAAVNPTTGKEESGNEEAAVGVGKNDAAISRLVEKIRMVRGAAASA